MLDILWSILGEKIYNNDDETNLPLIKSDYNEKNLFFPKKQCTFKLTQMKH